MGPASVTKKGENKMDAVDMKAADNALREAAILARLAKDAWNLKATILDHKAESGLSLETGLLEMQVDLVVAQARLRVREIRNEMRARGFSVS